MSVWLFLLIMGILLIAAILILFWHPQRSRTRANAFTDRYPSAFRDDERYWYGEVFYNNPNDPDLFVPKRFGMGWTLNLGHPGAKWIMIVTLLVVVLPPLLIAIIGTLYPGSIHPIGCHPSGCYPFP